MSNFKRKLKNILAKRHALSMRERILFIVVLFILVNLLLLGLGHLQSDTMDSVRSYVRGEGLYAKAQKDAVIYLQNYIRTGNQADYTLYLESLKVPLGDRAARMQLQSDNPDFEATYNGFLAGQNQAEDIPGMISFFQRFQHFPYMSDAIIIWSKADENIIKLQRLGKKIHLAQQNKNTALIPSLLKDLNKLNSILTRLVYQFSQVLSEGKMGKECTNVDRIRDVCLYVNSGPDHQPSYYKRYCAN